MSTRGESNGCKSAIHRCVISTTRETTKSNDFASREIRSDVWRLRHERSHTRRLLTRDSKAIDPHFTSDAGTDRDLRERPKQRALPAAVCAHDRDNFACRDTE